MTNPDLLALANELDDIETDAAGKCIWSEVATVSDALRRLASSEDAVKVRELDWHQHPDGETKRYEGGAAIGNNYAVFKAWWGLHHKWGWVGGDNGFFHTEEEAKAACQTDYEARIKSALVEVPVVKGEPEPVAWPANLNPRTLDLVQRFALALAKKLRLAEEKYGHTDGWLRDDWEAECRDHLYQHLEKGDPRDVAAYCAFMWHHGWSTTAPDDELNGCREALRKVTVKNARNEAKISDLNNMVLRYMHRAETNESAIRADEREKCAKLIEPKRPRPCDCDHCDCHNQGDTEAVAAWDADTAAAAAIRSGGVE